MGRLNSGEAGEVLGAGKTLIQPIIYVEIE